MQVATLVEGGGGLYPVAMGDRGQIGLMTRTYNKALYASIYYWLSSLDVALEPF